MPAVHTGGEWLFSSSNGIAPTGGISLISEQSVGGARDDRIATSDSTKKQDLNIDGAICLREVATGAEVGLGGTRGNAFAADSVRFAQAARIATGMAETTMTANLQGKPTIIISPRSDGLLPINHAGRAYFANSIAAFPKTESNTRLYEVTNAQHLDVLNGIPGFDSKFVPTHVYFTQAMNIMWSHLTEKKALPPSQVIRATPRVVKDSKTSALEVGNLPFISATPSPDAVIKFSNNLLMIPE